MAEDKPKPKGELHDEIISPIEGVPTIFIDGVQGLHMVNGVVKIGLYQIVQDLTPLNEDRDNSAAYKRVIIARLAMSPETLRKLQGWLNKVVHFEEVDLFGEPAGEDSGEST